MGKGTIYLYFKSKEDILYAILERRFRAYISETAGYYHDRSIDIVTKLINFIDHYIDELSYIKEIIFGSFDNFNSRVLRDILLKYGDHDSLEIKFILEIIRNSSIDIKIPRFIRVIIKEFLRLITGRALLFYLESRKPDKAMIKKRIKSEAEIIIKSFMLYLKSS